MKKHPILCLALITILLASPAWAGCGKWVIRDNTDYLSDPDFDQAVASSTGSAATLNSDSTAGVSSEIDGADEKAIQKEAETGEGAVLKDDPIIDLGGEWKVMLDLKMDGPEGQDRQETLDLILIQTKDRLQGYGTLFEEGGDLPATATGYISADSVSLNVMLVEQKMNYKLDLTAINDGMKGTCELYEEEKLAAKGNATASKSGS